MNTEYLDSNDDEPGQSNDSFGESDNVSDPVAYVNKILDQSQSVLSKKKTPQAQQTSLSLQPKPKQSSASSTRIESSSTLKQQKVQKLIDDDAPITETLDMIQSYIKTKKDDSKDNTDDVDYRFCMMMHLYLQMAPAESKGKIPAGNFKSFF